MKVLGFSKNGEMIKIEDSNDKKGYVWYFLAANVKAFATKIDIGTDVDLKTEERNGEDTVIFLSKKGSGVVQTGNREEYKCEACGAPLKDSKYKTCYDCSMKKRKEEEASPEGKARQSSIERQCALKASANAVATAMQGQLDVDTLGEAICKLFDKLYGKLMS